MVEAETCDVRLAKRKLSDLPSWPAQEPASESSSDSTPAPESTPKIAPENE